MGESSTDSGLELDTESEKVLPWDESHISKDIAYDLISDSTGITFGEYKRKCHGDDRVLQTMRRVTKELAGRHLPLFHGMIKRLGNSDNNVAMLTTVGESMFKDHKINWGRIVALYTLSVQWAKYLDQQGASKKDIEIIAQAIAQYIHTNLSPWIKQQGGWGDLCFHFPDRNQWYFGEIVRTLLLPGLAMGIIAGMIALR